MSSYTLRDLTKAPVLGLTRAADWITVVLKLLPSNRRG